MSAEQNCVVWWAAPVPPESAPGLIALLDAQERARLARFRRAADRARYLAAHALTRLVLAPLVDRAPAGLVFDRRCRCGEQHGKPTLPGGPPFSFTHGGDLIGLAVGAGDDPIGLDVEQVREMHDLAGMLEHISSPTERAAAQPPDPERFFVAWTRKEALLKATGDGIAAPMSAISLGPDGVTGWVGDAAPAGPVWLRDLRPEADYRAAVAGIGRAPATVTERSAAAALAAAAT